MEAVRFYTFPPLLCSDSNVLGAIASEKNDGNFP
jgi:hypothetical protein